MPAPLSALARLCLDTVTNPPVYRAEADAEFTPNACQRPGCSCGGDADPREIFMIRCGTCTRPADGRYQRATGTIVLVCDHCKKVVMRFYVAPRPPEAIQ